MDVVILLLDLMEDAYNIGTLVQTAVTLATRLAELATKIKRNEKDSPSGGKSVMWYATELALAAVSVLRHYQR